MTEPNRARLGVEDQALAQRMRRLAVELHPQGRRRLRVPARLARKVTRIGEECRRLRAEGLADVDLERLSEASRQMEAWSDQARREGGARLPACDGVPRVLRAMRALLSGGDVPLTEARFLLAVASFDDVQALTMAELWSAAAALRLAALESFIAVGQTVLDKARARRDAERWFEGSEAADRLEGRSMAFFERGLRLAAELERPEAREALEAMLERQEMTAAQCVAAAHEAQALDLMRLDNLASVKRMLEALDGQACFSLLSRADLELRRDPAGVYPQMEERSRAAVRAEVAVIARRLRLGETAVARHAVAAAAEALERSGAEDVRATLCWWLYTDAGRQALTARLRVGRRLPRLVPDPRGWGMMGGLALLTALFLAGMACLCGAGVALPVGLPLAWALAWSVAGRIVPLLFKPRPMLKLELERLGPERRTLVVIPALLSTAVRAEAVCRDLETLGCLERDPDVDLLILGDFRDGPASREKEDAVILAMVRGRLAALNARAGREKFFYLHRAREYAEVDGLWRGRERKRGALMALDRVLLGEANAAQAFAAEGAACAALAARRYAYVVTLDADTAMLPGTVQRLVGALAHPLNRLRRTASGFSGYAILQPNLELRAYASRNRFVRALAGRGGVDGYPVNVSSLHWDLTGRGIYGGKGVYDLRAFHAALDEALPDNRVLSHDLLEGLLARAGFLSDVSLYDGFPAARGAYLKRLERWTRGDWQLLPFLWGGAFLRPQRLDGLDRLKLVDNLLRSLAAPALLTLFLLGAWTGSPEALSAGVLFAFSEALLTLPHCRRGDWQRAAALLAQLPERAAAQLGAIGRALWRGFISHRHMLDWVTAADAEDGVRVGSRTARLAALLLLPGLIHPLTALPVLALGLLFWMGPGWLDDLAATPADADGALRRDQLAALTETARETWHFFATWVGKAEHGLPPDNVQIDPPRGVARRTSPTNIGLYLLACLSAWKLGFLSRETLLQRVEETVSTLEALDKWCGQLYNWYDIDTLRPLHPRYVSSVDGGNLAACLLLTAQALPEAQAVSARLRALAEAMDFTALYDARRKLFYIGIDVENERLSAAHYDLLASEARILSYVALMLG